MAWMWLAVAIVLNSAANLLLKVGAVNGVGVDGKPAGVHWASLVAIGLFVANLITFSKALQGLPMTVAMPVSVGGFLVLITLAAVLIPGLKERITPAQLAGMVVICVGVWLVTQGAHGSAQPETPTASAR